MKNLLWTFLISMVPVIELRGAIPTGILILGLPWYFVYPVSAIGNLLPVPFILFFIEKIFAWMKKVRLFPRLICWLEEKAQKGGGAIGYQVVIAETANENGVYGEGEDGVTIAEF